MNLLQSGEKDEGEVRDRSFKMDGGEKRKKKLVGKPDNLSGVTARQIERHRESSLSRCLAINEDKFHMKTSLPSPCSYVSLTWRSLHRRT